MSYHHYVICLTILPFYNVGQYGICLIRNLSYNRTDDVICIIISMDLCNTK